MSSGNCLYIWTLLSLSCLHSQRAFLTSWHVLPQLILTPLEPQQKGSTLFLIVPIKVWAKFHWPVSGNMPILWTSVCDTDWVTCLLMTWGWGQCSKPLKNIQQSVCQRKIGLLLPEGGLNDGQAKTEDVHCFRRFYRSMNCHHSRRIIRKTSRWPVAHLSRVLCLDSGFTWSHSVPEPSSLLCVSKYLLLSV